MGIGNIFKIDDRYINISLYFKSMIDKSKDMNKIVSQIYKL